MEPRIVQPGEGRDLHAFGDVVSVLLGGEETAGNLTVTLDVTPPTPMQPGAAVFLTRGSTHCYRYEGDTPSRQWILTTPSGFQSFFARCADEFARVGGPDMSQIVAIRRDHGIELVGS